MKKSAIEGILIRHDAEIESLLKGCTEMRAECVAELARKVAEFSAKEREAATAALESKTGKLRARLIDDSAAKLVGVIAEEREMSAKDRASFRRAFIEHVTELASAREAQVKKEFDERLSLLKTQHLALSESIRLLAEGLPGKIREFAKNTAPAPLGFADIYQGVLSEGAVYRRGQIWSYQGGTYLALKDGKGDLPSRTKNGLPNATWATIAAPGMSGARGSPYSATPSIAMNSGAVVVAAPASATAAGVAGTFAYDNNWWYVCVSTNKWKRTAIGSW